MSRFTVTYASLRALEDALVGVAAQLYYGGNSVPTGGNQFALKGYSQTDYGVLNGGDYALGEYFGAWQTALAVIGTNIEVLAKQLGEAADTYACTDVNIANAAASAKAR